MWRKDDIQPELGMSAHELFQLISTSITPHMQMIQAAHYLKQIGIHISKHSRDDIIGHVLAGVANGKMIKFFQ